MAAIAFFEDAPRAYLLCGKVGAGKTTYALELESRGAMRLSLDEWTLHFYATPEVSRAVFDAQVATCREMILCVAEQVVAKGISVVLDLGFWRRAERDSARQRMHAAGALPLLYWFDIPDAEQLRRLAQRNAALPVGTYEITPAMLEEFAQRFEAPIMEEGFVAPPPV